MGINDVVGLALVCGTICACGIIPLLAWRRGKPARNPAFERDVADRLNRLEQSIDAIAVEIERVSESQRFVTKIMSDRGLGLASARSSDPERLGP
ncbi:MAG: hypothetical protein ACYCVL_07770 [Gemmatimonadaceae bacterium]